jgi:ABC-type phosphate transport system auxiliary subunit
MTDEDRNPILDHLIGFRRDYLLGNIDEDDVRDQLKKLLLGMSTKDVLASEFANYTATLDGVASSIAECRSTLSRADYNLVSKQVDGICQKMERVNITRDKLWIKIASLRAFPVQSEISEMLHMNLDPRFKALKKELSELKDEVVKQTGLAAQIAEKEFPNH